MQFHQYSRPVSTINPNREFDLIIGGVRFDHVNSTKFERSSPYMQDDITWCVSGAKPIPQWKNILYIADPEVLIIALIMIVLGGCIIFFMYAFEEVQRDLFYCFYMLIQTSLGLPTTFKGKSYIHRISYGVFLMISFLITQIVSAYCIFMIPRILSERQISTLQEIATNNYHLAGDRHVIDHFWMKNMVRIHSLGNYSFIY